MNALVMADAKQLNLIRNTVAKDCNTTEFDMFMHICKAVRLDPLRRQIYAFVFSKDDPSKRQMTVVTAIGGYRSIAERSHNYLPDKHTPRITYDASLIGPANPLGIFKCEVSVFKFSHGAWHEVVAEAHWDDYAPVMEGGTEGTTWEKTGENYPTGHAKAGKPKYRKVTLGEAVTVLDPTKPAWKKGRIMLPKCAEAQALRKAWPDDFAGLEVEEEVHQRLTTDFSASELADEGASAARFGMIGGSNALTVDWCDGNQLMREPVGTFGDKVMAFIRENSDAPMTIRAFQNRNTAALQEYWAKDKNGALELKKAFETAVVSEAAE